MCADKLEEMFLVRKAQLNGVDPEVYDGWTPDQKARMWRYICGGAQIWQSDKFNEQHFDNRPQLPLQKDTHSVCLSIA
jgi:hypothetical protein